MRDLNTLTYHKLSEDIIDILCQKVQNNNKLFFRILVAYYLAKIASNMRVSILTKDRGLIPVNLYAINLAPSGEGKNFSTNIIEEQVISEFKTVFVEETLPIIEEQNLTTLAIKRSNIKNTDPDEELEKVKREYKNLGTMPFDFDSGTTPAFKQLRYKMLMAEIGALSLQIDEIGSNLLSNTDLLSTMFETFDVGKTNQKITKNTKDNFRNEEIDGKVPANMLLFGTPNRLLNGGKTEDEFFSFLETGYARRCMFGFTKLSKKNINKTAEEIYDQLTNKASDALLQKISNKLALLANAVNYNKHIIMSKDVSIQLIEYRLYCDKLANALPEYEEMKKAEITHRYFKTLKLAGTYAFADQSSEITEDILYNAIKLAEESGKAFCNLLDRDKNYVKLAKYLASINKEVTHVDLVEDLPFYNGSATARNDLMQMAIAWGYKNHIMIQQNQINNIEFIKGSTLQPTNLNKLIISYSKDIAFNYKNDFGPFDKLYQLTDLAYMNWINHHTKDGHRFEDCIIPGFNLVVLDIDDGVTISIVKKLFKEYTYLLYTTKRHTSSAHRFRIILPINYILELNEKDYHMFMVNVFNWLPFKVDTNTGQRSRKWLSNKGTYFYNKTDQLFDALLFIPHTNKNDEQKQLISSQQSLSNLERWFLNNTNIGRNNQLLKYAFILVDMGYSLPDIETKVKALNEQLPNKLKAAELKNTILSSTAKKVIKRDS